MEQKHPRYKWEWAKLHRLTPRGLEGYPAVLDTRYPGMGYCWFADSISEAGVREVKWVTHCLNGGMSLDEITEKCYRLKRHRASGSPK